MWNFKGHLWNSTQNILTIHWKIWFLYNAEILKNLSFKSSYVFWKVTQPPMCEINPNLKHWNRILKKSPCYVISARERESNFIEIWFDHNLVKSYWLENKSPAKCPDWDIILMCSYFVLDWLAMKIQWNLSVTTTSEIKFITCDLFSNVF